MSVDRTTSSTNPGLRYALPGIHSVRVAVDSLAAVAFVAYFLGVYLDITIYSGLQPVLPDVIALFASAVFMGLRWSMVSVNDLMSIGTLILLAIVLFVVTSVTHGSISAKSINGTGNLVIAWVAGYGAFLMIKSNSRSVNATIFAILWGGLLIGALLELAGPLREVSDAFRVQMFRYQILNSDVVRDVDLYGQYRPKVFSAEPSLVGVWFSVTICAWLLLYPVKLWGRRTLVFLTGVALMFYIERSPTILFCLPILAYALFSQGESQGASSARSGSTWQYVRLAAMCLAIIGVGVAFNVIPTSGLFAFMQGGSFYFRMIAPPGLAAQIVEKYPLFGIGISNQELLNVETTNYFMSHYQGAIDILSIQTSVLNVVANSFYLQWIYAGIVGSFILMAAYLRFGRELGIRDSAAVLACALLLFSISGGYVTVKTWAIYFMIAGARYVYEAEQAKSSPRQQPRQA